MSDAANPCKCGHAFTSHTRDVRESGAMRIDFPTSGGTKGDIFSGGSEVSLDVLSVPAVSGNPPTTKVMQEVRDALSRSGANNRIIFMAL
jgi:hypothetical protein